MFCSIVVPTIGRSSLNRTIKSVLSQNLQDSEYEIIIVNDSGEELPEDTWSNSNLIKIINTNKRERNFARNSGAAISKGQYLWFLDDDDWILPGALEIFHQLTLDYPNAIWFYGGLKIVDEKDGILAEVNSRLSGNCFAQIMGGAWVPIQTSIVSARSFFEIGCFNTEILGTEDLDLCRRFAYYGDFANTSESVACLLRGESWQTSTNYQRAPHDTKRSRDNVLKEPAAFTHLIQSAKTPYWFGRVLRVYLSTITWNIERWRWFTAVSRFIYSLFVIIRANMHTLSRDFWAGLIAEHVPGTLHFVMEEYEKEHAKN